MTPTDVIGYMAATVGTFLMLPQVVRSYRTKRVADVSGVMVIAYLLNCFLWTLYGFFIDATPVIVCNIIGFFIGCLQAGIKVRYSR